MEGKSTFPRPPKSPKASNTPNTRQPLLNSKHEEQMKSRLGKGGELRNDHREVQDASPRQARGCAEELLPRIANRPIHYFQPHRPHRALGQQFGLSPQKLTLNSAGSEAACCLKVGDASKGEPSGLSQSEGTATPPKPNLFGK